MSKLFKSFAKRETGAVTVDWVVLTAAIVGLCGVVFAALYDATGGLGTSVGEYLNEKTIE
ncbi:hypothetical protein [Pseudodonghicola flavimaris]|uniref:Pilus assembly protein n=1 Tax=Pseudodonghicola flavimaris TaxID=3050036 RepID=A0ABT7EXP0_9RHOB|nr:hypothetical protein [Pseudodonghicola flavimaris]MDK3017121.1 hypothetical protein [Pseudodonghicola flavimaris]